MQFKYYNILWVFLGLMVLVFLFMPSKEAIEEADSIVQKRIPQNEKNGPILTYSENGTLKTKVTYTNGIKNGSSYLYYPDGKTIQLEMPYVNGKREGVSRKYYENGKIYAETSYKNDLLDGIRRLFFTNGKVKAEIPYRENNPGIGLIEYLVNGGIKTPNEMEINQENHILRLSTSQPCRELKFYIGKLIDDQFFDPIDSDVQLLTSEDSQFYIDLNTFNTSYLKYQDIICSCETRQGNPLILKQRIDISSLKNVNQ
jgi:antitoxin component YwqK of YwqJK toxin-antitoxin module